MTPTEIHNIWLHMSGKSEGIMEAGGESDFPVLFATAILQYDRMERGADNLDRMSKPNKRPLLEEWIAQADKQEPVAWVDRTCLKNLSDDFEPTIGKRPVSEYDVPLYTTPQPQREWVGLTDEEIDQGLLRSDYALQTAHAWRAGVVFAMTQLKEKNT